MIETTDDLILEKLLILYILNNLKEDVTGSQLTQIILETDIINYFTLLVVLPKMSESKFITKYTKNNTTLYTITQSGLEVLIYFQNRIPDYFKEKLDLFIKEHSDDIFSSQIKRQSSYSMQEDSTYVVSLIVIKGNKNVMTMNLNVDAESEAKLICRKWENVSDDKYSKILEILNA